MIGPLIAALALCAVHFVTPGLRFLSNAPRSRWLSFAGGASLGYVFLHLLPEIAEGEVVLAEEAGRIAQYGFGIWGVALASLIGFYGLERLVQRDAMRRNGKDEAERPHVFWLHLVSFGFYNLLTGYLLVQREGALAVFAIALGLHLLTTDFGLLEAFRAGYLRVARWALTAALLAGWAVGAATEVPEIWVVTVTAVLGGGVILNVLKEELPSQRESRFLALLAGVLVFAAVLLLEALWHGGAT